MGTKLIVARSAPAGMVTEPGKVLKSTPLVAVPETT